MYISIDIGGTTTKTGSSENLENIILEKRQFSNSHNFEEDWRLLLKDINSLSHGHVQGIGLGAPGDIDDTKSFIKHSANVKGYEGKELRKMLGEQFHCPVFMDNDGVIAAFGEGMYGNPSRHDFVYIIWGTGVGGATVAYEKNGHLILRLLDWFEYFKMWENNCGGAKIIEKYGKPGTNLNESEWNKTMKSFEEELNKVITKLSPSKIIFGGGISIKQKPRLMKLSAKFPSINISLSSLGEETGLYGGFALLKNSL